MPNWTDGLTKAEIITLANMLINSTNRVLSHAGGIEWKPGGCWDGYHDYMDLVRDNRTLLANLEVAYVHAL